MSSGKKPGAGRKAGAAWKSDKPKPVRTIARANLISIMEGGQDPLLGLLEIAGDRAVDVDVRVRAYAAALPYTRPRLSMQVIADATPRDGQPTVSQEALLARMLQTLDRLAPPRPVEALVIEAEPDDQKQPETP